MQLLLQPALILGSPNHAREAGIPHLFRDVGMALRREKK